MSIGNIGTADNLNTFIVSSSGTVTLNGTIDADNGINLTNVVDLDLAENSGIFTTNNSNILLNSGAVDGAQDVVFNAGTGVVTLGVIGQNTAVTSLTVNAADGTHIDGDITTTGDLNLSQDGIVLDTDITLESINANVTLGDLDAGNESLIVIADSDDSASGTVDLGAITRVDNLTISAGEDITVTEAITGIGVLSFTANADGGGVDHDDDLTIQASIVGAEVILNASGQEADIIVNADQNNTIGSITFADITMLAGDVACSG